MKKILTLGLILTSGAFSSLSALASQRTCLNLNGSYTGTVKDNHGSTASDKERVKIVQKGCDSIDIRFSFFGEPEADDAGDAYSTMVEIHEDEGHWQSTAFFSTQAISLVKSYSQGKDQYVYNEILYKNKDGKLVWEQTANTSTGFQKDLSVIFVED